VVVIVNEAKARVEIGRQKSNDIQVVNNRVSRTHALIEYKNGKYYLSDQSSNGTFLLMEGRKGITVRNKEVLLTAKGVIGPGYKVDFKSPDAIHILFEQNP
jgi:pSer/pThr/pTyr-binding forkhead associated (FHA) protein